MVPILFSSGHVNGTMMKENYQPEKPVQKIIYQFHDSSVPPKYHRSYVITVICSMVKIVIDSYGEILADREYEITEEQFVNIVESLRKNGIKNMELGGNENCIGGTGESISVSDERSFANSSSGP